MLRDGNRGLSITNKAECTQEIRLGCSPKLRFRGMLLSLRLLEIFSRLIKLCVSQKQLLHYQLLLIACKHRQQMT